MKLYIEIKADTNDADYVTQRTEINEEELENLLPIIEVVKNIGIDHNWPAHEHLGYSLDKTYQGLLSEEQLTWFNGFVPCGEYGVHSIDSIKILTIIEEEELL